MHRARRCQVTGRMAGTCYEAIGKRNARASIPPQHNAKAERVAWNESPRRIRQIGRVTAPLGRDPQVEP